MTKTIAASLVVLLLAPHARAIEAGDSEAFRQAGRVGVESGGAVYDNDPRGDAEVAANGRAKAATPSLRLGGPAPRRMREPGTPFTKKSKFDEEREQKPKSAPSVWWSVGFAAGGALVGAGVGFLLGGPMGALIGGIIGGLFGWFAPRIFHKGN